MEWARRMQKESRPLSPRVVIPPEEQVEVPPFAALEEAVRRVAGPPLPRGESARPRVPRAALRVVDDDDDSSSGDERHPPRGALPLRTEPTPAFSELPPELSERAQRLIAGRLEPQTAKSYKRVWERYVRWCQKSGCQPMVTDRLRLAVQTANFVADEHIELGIGYSACKTRVAAISTKLKPILGFGVGEEPVVTSLMTGVRKVRPDAPRYEDHPDLGLIWALFDKWGPNEDLDTRQLVGKTSALLLLFGLRKSDQVKVDLSASVFNEDVVMLRALPKETRSCAWVVQPVPASATHPTRCAVAALNELVRRRPKHSDPRILFVNLDGSPSSSKWLTSCVKYVMCQALIDTSKYKPHCLRGMGPSRCTDAGFSDALIYSQFRWSPHSQTYARHYLRTQKLKELGEAIYQ